MQICNRSWVFCSVLCVLATSGPETVAANDGTAGTPVGVSVDQSSPSPESIPSKVPGFDPDALDLNVYGLTYHPDRDTVHRLKLDNEFNPGMGLHYQLNGDARGNTFVEIGFYQDSGSNWAKFGALGYQFKLGKYWRFGAALAAMHSQTYNRGVTFLAMIPLMTCDLGRIKLNAVYIPKFGDYNKVAAFGFYISFPLGNPDR